MKKTIKERILDILEWWAMMLPFVLVIFYLLSKVWLDTSCSGLL